MAKKRPAAAVSGDEGKPSRPRAPRKKPVPPVDPTAATPDVKPEPKLPSEAELRTLPPRAVVAYAARCARRVQPLFDLPVDHPEREEHLRAVKVAISLAAASSTYATDSESTNTAASATFAAARAAAVTSAARAAAAAAAFAAFAAANHAASPSAASARAAASALAATSEAGDRTRFVDLARRDFDLLKAMWLSDEDFIDATETGPLGKYWGRERPPDWYLSGLEKLRLLGIIPDPNAKPADAGTTAPISVLTDDTAALSLRIKSLEQERDGLKHVITGRADLTRYEEEQLQKDFSALEKQRDELRNEKVELNREKNQEIERLRAEVAALTIKNEDESVQGLGFYARTIFKVKHIFGFLTLSLLTVLVVTNLFAISEVYERQAFDRWLKNHIEELRNAGPDPIVLLKLVAAIDPDRNIPALPPTTAPALERSALEGLRAQLQVLSSTGSAERTGTVAGLRDALKAMLPVNSAAGAAPGRFSTSTRTWAEWLGGLDWLSYKSSDLLLSLVVLFSGTVGAVITSIRKDKRIDPRDLGQGLAAGFVTFLVVRGGKNVFLMDSDPMLLVNPYNTAFLGLIAGMFTELAYELLTAFVEEMTRRLKNTVGPTNGETTPPASAS